MARPGILAASTSAESMPAGEYLTSDKPSPRQQLSDQMQALLAGARHFHFVLAALRCSAANSQQPHCSRHKVAYGTLPASSD